MKSIEPLANPFISSEKKVCASRCISKRLCCCVNVMACRGHRRSNGEAQRSEMGFEIVGDHGASVFCLGSIEG
jgi:hypothetical protein